MISRRILAGACALCLAVPAAATAKDVRFVGHLHHSVPAVATGDTKYDLVSTPPAHNTAVAQSSATQSAGTSDDTNGWQIAALAEAALVATVAVGAAAVAGRRSSAPHMGV